MPLNLIISIHLIFTLIYICSEKLNIKNYLKINNTNYFMGYYEIKI